MENVVGITFADAPSPPMSKQGVFHKNEEAKKDRFYRKATREIT